MCFHSTSPHPSQRSQIHNVHSSSNAFMKLMAFQNPSMDPMRMQTWRGGHEFQAGGPGACASWGSGPSP